MNKSKSTGVYVILAIVVAVFLSTILMSGPVTNTSEISYTSFLQKLENKELKRVLYVATGALFNPSMTYCMQYLKNSPNRKRNLKMV